MSSVSALPSSAPLSSAGRPKMNALTSTRFFAALYVVFFHFRWGLPRGGALDQFLDVGYVAVSFFFLLSGYILAMVYLRNEKKIDPATFYSARFARIYPLFIACVLLDTPFAVMMRISKYGLAGAVERVIQMFMGTAVMLHMFLPTIANINVPSWSLSIEAVFYLIFPILGPVLWRLRKRSLYIIAPAIYLASLTLRYVVAGIWPVPLPVLELPSFIGIFAIGILAARLSVNSEAMPGRIASHRLFAWGVLIASLAGFGLVVIASPWLLQHRIHLGLLLAPVFVGVIWTLSASCISGMSWLNAKWLVILGEASFGIYLLQWPVRQLLELFHLTGSLLDYPLFFGLLLGISVLSFRYYESPARRWILEMFHSRTKETWMPRQVAMVTLHKQSMERAYDRSQDSAQAALHRLEGGVEGVVSDELIRASIASHRGPQLQREVSMKPRGESTSQAPASR
jgi:peptidoglycan/LPS O-acetylase OafA/YrhL